MRLDQNDTKLTQILIRKGLKRQTNIDEVINCWWLDPRHVQLGQQGHDASVFRWAVLPPRLLGERQRERSSTTSHTSDPGRWSLRLLWVHTAVLLTTYCAHRSAWRYLDRHFVAHGEHCSLLLRLLLPTAASLYFRGHCGTSGGGEKVPDTHHINANAHVFSTSIY